MVPGDRPDTAIPKYTGEEKVLVEEVPSVQSVVVPYIKETPTEEAEPRSVRSPSILTEVSWT